MCAGQILANIFPSHKYTNFPSSLPNNHNNWRDPNVGTYLYYFIWPSHSGSYLYYRTDKPLLNPFRFYCFTISKRISLWTQGKNNIIMTIRNKKITKHSRTQKINLIRNRTNTHAVWVYSIVIHSLFTRIMKKNSDQLKSKMEHHTTIISRLGAPAALLI